MLMTIQQRKHWAFANLLAPLSWDNSTSIILLRVYAYILESQAFQRSNATRQVKILKGVDGIAANSYSFCKLHVQLQPCTPMCAE
jgi:hypothetical protein